MHIYILYIRVIPQGTVDNNLGPDRLASPKALVLRTTNPLIARPLSESRNCAWYCVMPHTINVSHLTVGTTLNVFSYDAVWAKN